MSIRLLAMVVSLMAIVGLVVTAASAQATTDAEELSSFGSEGPNAGQLSLPEGMATDPSNGDIYTGGGNNRIEEFTPWGEFVKAFGWGVTPGPVNEEQEVRVRAVAGQFKLSFGASVTGELPFDASAVQVQDALNGLTSVGEVGGSVDVREVKGTADGVSPFIYVVTFKGSLGGTDVAQLVAANGAQALSGGSPSTSLEVRTRADGGAGGSGLESCTTAGGCQKGTAGSGAGQIGSVFSIAVDSSGDVYVREPTENRVQKFNSDGQFLLMFGGGVDKSQVARREEQEAKNEPVTVTAQDEDVCPAASGDQCGSGVEGTGPGQFGSGGLDIAIGSNGTVYVGDVDRIEAFEPSGRYQSQIALPGKVVRYFAVSPVTGDFYVVSGNISAAKNVLWIDPSGTNIGTFEVESPGAVATDPEGNVYVVDREYLVDGERDREHIVEFNQQGAKISEFAVPPPLGTLGEHYQLYGLSSNAIGDIYVANDAPGFDTSIIRSFGPAPVNYELPPTVPPTIVDQYAGSVNATGAELHAKINPHFWSDTSYYVEYGIEACDISTCARRPASSSAQLTDKVTNLTLTSAGLELEGLRPATTYHYRFVAQSSGGGPVYGPDGTFHTFPEATEGKTGCSNQAARVGLSSLLMDCRGYEMVSPVEKNNGDAVDLLELTGYHTALDESSNSGEALTYTSYRPFGDAQSGPFVSQYVARRDPQTGWSSEAISPAHGVGAGVGTQFYDLFENEYKFFSPELTSGWFQLYTEPPLSSGTVDNSPNFYRRDGSSGSYETVTSVLPPFAEPTFGSSGVAEPELQDVSADGTRTVFRINAQLTPDASTGYYSVYEFGGGALRPICVLPNGAPATESCSAGTAVVEANETAANRVNSVAHSVSSDGSNVYWTASPPNAKVGAGALYLRENAGQEQSAISGGHCIEPTMACSVPVSQVGITAHYLDASTDGSRAIYEVEDGSSTLNGDLYLFNSQSGEGPPRTLIAKAVQGVLGASDDLSYVYFTSKEVIAGTSGALAKEPNLYLYHEGAYTFIATLAEHDVAREGIFGVDDVSAEPIYHASSVTPDGRHIVFISTARLTGYDNTDAISGKPDFEVFTYEAGASVPVCVSCNPSGARPAGVQVEEDGAWFAAAIPSWETQLYAPRVISDEGSRVFFDSYDDLIPRDTNGEEDVYEWESPGTGDCAESDPSYSATNAGCVNLISSGQSAQASEFRDASANGNDVFFSTESSLVPQDSGLIDIYDARVDGGVTVPGSRTGCEGEACQNTPAPPIDSTPASLTFSGAGDVVTPLRATVKAKAKPLTRAQKLKRALRACRSKPKRIRASCESQARRRYGGIKRATHARKGAK